MPRGPRPVFLDFLRIRFPVGAVASFGHRASGVALLCALPFAVLALQRSLEGEASFDALLAAMRSPFGRAILVVAAWASAQHVLAGVRHLLSDAGIGSSLRVSRRSAFAVLAGAAAVAAAVGLFA
jgi:succinate dehydrogenase / fumarate reductase, cytochrome b subunit